MVLYSIFLVLLLVLLCSVSPVNGKKNLFSQLGDIVMTGNKNDVKQKENSNIENRRRLLEEKKRSAVDMDAATGTVQNAASKKDATCDGQLASALVQANELVTVVKEERDQAFADQKSALEKIRELENDFAQVERNLIEEQDSRGALEIEMARALKVEKERSMKKLEEVKEESVRVLEQVKKESEEEIRSLRREKDEIITSLEAKLKISVEKMESTLKLEINKVQKEKKNSVIAVEVDRDAKIEKLSMEMKDAIDEIKKDRDTKVEELTSAMKNAVENLEHDRDAKVAELVQNMEIASKDAENLLRISKSEAKQNLLKQMTAVKDELTQANIQCDERLSEKNKKISSLQESNKDLLEMKSLVDVSLNEAYSELGYWRTLYSNRSYCNMTYIANDVYNAGTNAYSQALEIFTESRKHAAVATKLAGEHVSHGLEYSGRFINDQVDEHWPAIQPYYKEHIVDNYEAHIEPHLREHLFPLLNQAKMWHRNKFIPWAKEKVDDCHVLYNTQVLPILHKFSEELKNIHHEMTVLCGDYCLYSLQEFLKISKKSDLLKQYPSSTYFMESWKSSCAHPRESLNVLMQGILIVFLIFFRHRIFRLLRFFSRLLWSFVRFLLSTIIHLTPLRFVLLRHESNTLGKSNPQSVSAPPSVNDTDTTGSKRNS